MRVVTKDYSQNGMGNWVSNGHYLIPGLTDILAIFREFNLDMVKGIIVAKAPDVVNNHIGIPIDKDRAGKALDEYVKARWPDSEFIISKVIHSGILPLYVRWTTDSSHVQHDLWWNFTANLLSRIENEFYNTIPILTLGCPDVLVRVNSQEVDVYKSCSTDHYDFNTDSAFASFLNCLKVKHHFTL
jgi:hypothetical protein